MTCKIIMGGAIFVIICMLIDPIIKIYNLDFIVINNNDDNMIYTIGAVNRIYKKASKICNGHYKVIEKTKWPYTLEAEQIDQNTDYLVVRCEKNVR